MVYKPCFGPFLIPLFSQTLPPVSPGFPLPLVANNLSHLTPQPRLSFRSFASGKSPITRIPLSYDNISMTWLPHTLSHFPRAFATCFREVLPSTLLATGAVGADSRLASQV